ncbi:MAG: hypothetical protein M1825_001125 [Sarcosagium campestre]|nr:MAG: hypothetical protein M1825_001125 [Sarcosagium campestre]
MPSASNTRASDGARADGEDVEMSDGRTGEQLQTEEASAPRHFPLRTSPRSEAAASLPSSSPTSALPVYMTRKRAASLATTDQDEQAKETPNVSTSNSSEALQASRDLPPQVCICPPDPKIPRPRNGSEWDPLCHDVQNLQASVVRQNPGLANPEISKIIGHQWRQEPQEIKDYWDKLANPRRKLRRGTDPTSETLSPQPEDWCPKCGFRSMTPGTPLTPFTPSFGRALPPLTPALASAGSQAGFPRRLNPIEQIPPQAVFTRRAQMPSHALTIENPRELGAIKSTELRTPDLKRRRYNAYSHSQAELRTPNGQETFARPDNHAGRMEPPARPGVPLRHIDPSLTLPPLQSLQSQERTVNMEAAVNSIFYINKIRSLSRICPPLPATANGNPDHKTRGAIIAIDGDDSNSVLQVVNLLGTEFERGGEYAVKVFQGPQEKTLPAAKGDEPRRRTFETYLHDISAWHQTSSELSAFISKTPVLPKLESSPGQEVSTSTSPPAEPRTPLALVPSYMLTQVNQAAIKLANDDAYPPTEHWHWAAMLWRGVVGPDLTIWVMKCPQSEVSRYGSVEIVPVARTFVIRYVGEQVDIKIGRRLGFEVGEWARSVARGDRSNSEG